LEVAVIPYVFPLGFFVFLVAVRRVPSLSRRYTVADAAAWSLSALLVLTGSAHFVGLRDDLIRMVPPLFPRPDLLVTLTGIFELAGAVGLMIARTRTAAGVALALFFVALLPANIYAAQAGLTLGGKPVTPLVLRIPEQFMYIAFALVPAWKTRALKLRAVTAHA
jgi:uncharacterized membrane protein